MCTSTQATAIWVNTTFRHAIAPIDRICCAKRHRSAAVISFNVEINTRGLRDGFGECTAIMRYVRCVSADGTGGLLNS